MESFGNLLLQTLYLYVDAELLEYSFYGARQGNTFN
jgi:hypothetical protein